MFFIFFTRHLAHPKHSSFFVGRERRAKQQFINLAKLNLHILRIYNSQLPLYDFFNIQKIVNLHRVSYQLENCILPRHTTETRIISVWHLIPLSKGAKLINEARNIIAALTMKYVIRI